VRERHTALAAAAQFVTEHPPVDVAPVLHGHIHDTYVVTCSGSGATGDAHDGESHASATARIVLQRVNGDVFTDLDGLANNLQRITTHLQAVAVARGTRPLVATTIETRAGGSMRVDEHGRAWRATRFVEGTRPLGPDATADELRAAARAFAELTRDLDDLGPPALVETIPRFHDLARREADLGAAVASDRVGRAPSVRDLIDDARDLGARITTELAADDASALPPRIVHNDAKLNNVLVDSATGAVACIVDLDTVMTGSVLNDFGELARTATSGAPEDEPDPSAITVDLERFAALADGYTAGARGFLLEPERDCLALAGPLLSIENGVRFLTDHLNGDVYFRVHHPDHNAQRCRAQFRLATLMLEQLDRLREIISAAGITARSAS
jgi:hypothetical protein